MIVSCMQYALVHYSRLGFMDARVRFVQFILTGAFLMTKALWRARDAMGGSLYYSIVDYCCRAYYSTSLHLILSVV